VALPANDGEMFYFKPNTVITIDCVKRMKKRKENRSYEKFIMNRNGKHCHFFSFFGSLAMN